ncbi:hypothetical protein HKCCE2091_12300 [Rhodobacterales bacterium HKCCE2091]|nr:hypothetical protein [Rhodobacterales bacterium HKCCE2091]
MKLDVRMILFVSLIAFLVIFAAITIYRVFLVDEVQRRYDTMVVFLEEQCSALTTEIDCAAYAGCYRDGLEDAFPRDVMARIVDEGRAFVVPSEVEEAHFDLQRSCAEDVGLTLEGVVN